MIIDKSTLLSDRQAVTSDAASTHIIDLGPAGTPHGGAAMLRRDLGAGEPVPLLVQVVESFDNLTSLTISLQVDDDPGFGSPKTVATNGAVPLAQLTQGYQVALAAVPLGTDERYLRLFFDVTGTAPAAGRITAGLAGGLQTNR